MERALVEALVVKEVQKMMYAEMTTETSTSARQLVSRNSSNSNDVVSSNEGTDMYADTLFATLPSSQSAFSIDVSIYSQR